MHPYLIWSITTLLKPESDSLLAQVVAVGVPLSVSFGIGLSIQRELKTQGWCGTTAQSRLLARALCAG